MWLRVFIGACRTGQFAGLMVDIEVTLAWPINTIGPMHAGVEPLRRVWCRHLRGQHETHLVKIGARIFLAGEVTTFPAPIGPGAGKTVEYLLGRFLADIALFFRQFRQRLFIGHRTPEP